MKIFNLIFVLFLGFAIGSVSAQIESAKSEIPASGPVMEFVEMVVDYGAIEQHSDPLRIAKFTNTGTEPLVIKNARGSCGCTVPTYPKQPIMPGESAEVEIRYDTKRIGKINKTVTITTNEVGDPKVLKVIGQITKAPEDAGVPAAKNSLIKGS
ncbi:MAG: hypothetical protein ACI9FN_000430 [Saprospiraceae bacterium]|jgi:hypothetical protein